MFTLCTCTEYSYGIVNNYNKHYAIILILLDEILTPLQNKIPYLNVIDAIRSEILSILYLIDIFVNLSNI